jgi:hypothetical protein
MLTIPSHLHDKEEGKLPGIAKARMVAGVRLIVVLPVTGLVEPLAEATGRWRAADVASHPRHRYK